MKIFLKAIYIVIVTFLTGILLINLYILAVQVIFKEDLPKVFGYARAHMVSGSMEPAIRVGDMIVIREQANYEIGDVVTYRANSLITHRIIANSDEGYITKGDANNTDDGAISADRIEGRIVLVIPHGGYLVDFIKSPLGLAITVILGLLLVELPYWIGKRKKRRRFHNCTQLLSDHETKAEALNKKS